MTIDFIEEEFRDNPQIIPSLKFSADGEHRDCSLYLDDILVAYFDNTTGGLCLMPLEVGSGFTGGGDWDNIKHLESRGVKFDKVPHRWNKEGYWEYYIQVSK